MADELKIIALDNAICESSQLKAGSFTYDWALGIAVSSNCSSKQHKVVLESATVKLTGGISTPAGNTGLTGTFSFTSDVSYSKMNNEKPLRIGLTATALCTGVSPSGSAIEESITITLKNPSGYEPVLFGE